MKRNRAVALLFFPLLALAQDDTASAIKATTVLHEDGTKTVTILDPEKHTSEATTYTGANKVTQRIVYQLDDENQTTAGTVYAANGTVVLKCVYKHDSASRINEEIDYTPDDRLLRRFVYEFGANGKVSRIRAYDADGNEIPQSAARADEKKMPPRRHR